MKNLFPALILASSLATFSIPVRAAETAPRAARAEFEDRIRTLNETTKRNHAQDAAMHGVAVETGVPPEKLRRIHEDYPKVSPAGIFVACIIADNTKEDPAIIVKRGAAGKSWTSLALEYNVPFEKIERRLVRLENYIRAGGDERPVERREREHHN